MALWKHLNLIHHLKRLLFVLKIIMLNLFCSSELPHLCKHFRLDSRNLLESVKSDSQGHVTYTDLNNYLLYHDSAMERVHSPGPPIPPPISSTALTTNASYSIPHTIKGLSAQYQNYTPYTDESFTPEDNIFHHQEVVTSIACSLSRFMSTRLLYQMHLHVFVALFVVVFVPLM